MDFMHKRVRRISNQEEILRGDHKGSQSIMETASNLEEFPGASAGYKTESNNRKMNATAFTFNKKLASKTPMKTDKILEQD